MIIIESVKNDLLFTQEMVFYVPKVKLRLS